MKWAYLFNATYRNCKHLARICHCHLRQVVVPFCNFSFFCLFEIWLTGDLDLIYLVKTQAGKLISLKAYQKKKLESWFHSACLGWNRFSKLGPAYAPGNEHKLLSLSEVNAPGLPDNKFWWVGLVAGRFYQLEVSPKGSSLVKYPMLFSKNEKKKVRISLVGL